MASSSSGGGSTAGTPNLSAVPSTENSRSTTPTKTLDKAPGNDDSSKLRTLFGILKRFIGVTDIAAVRFSLPAQLMEPIPNLEYWTYLDRPETFASIADSDEPLGRFLAVLRFWFTKDLKYVKGRPCKPYNSTLGEFFRCNWEVDELLPILPTAKGQEPPLEAKAQKQDHTIKISYITEQTSHHPPVSAYYVDCPEKGISAHGYDQISGKFTGTSIRIQSGEHNKGIFLTLRNRDNEQYHMTHPNANLGGFLKGSLSISVTDKCTITCAQTKLKAILEYSDDGGWFGKSASRVDCAIYNYDPANDKREKIKEIPEKDIVARVEGLWHDKLFYTIGSAPSKTTKDSDKHLLIDVNPLFPSAKVVPPEDVQLPNESRRLWTRVTEQIQAKQFGEATKLKQDIEEKQREKAVARKEKNQEWKPRFFKGIVDPSGKPELSEDGQEVIKNMQAGQYAIKPTPDAELGS